MLPALVLIAGVLASVVVLALVRSIVGYGRLAESNEVAGAFFTTIGTIYAVILAFMVFAVWTDFQEGEALCDREANEAISLLRLSYSLSPAVDGGLQREVVAYLRSVIDDEWPRMMNGGESETTAAHLQSVWSEAMRLDPRTPREQTIFDHLLTHVDSLGQSRRSRLFKSHEDLPAVLWIVLGLGGVITLVSSCLFGLRSGRLHAFQTAMLAALLLFVLYAIAEMKHPFQGRVRVESTSFSDAIREMAQIQREMQSAPR